jgi:glycosyltransferase involved in cell wall biosynthesis
VTEAATGEQTLGFLHVGRPESGVRRYGRIIADEAAARPDLHVLQAEAGLLEGRRGGLAARGRALSGADVVHLQWNRRSWGSGPRAAYRYLDFRGACERPLVVTLHDVFDRHGLRQRWLEPEALALRLVGRSAERVVVHSQIEVERLSGLVPAERVRVVPHFVERRDIAIGRDEARARLGVEGRRVVTLLGFIYGRKGHKVLLEAIPHLDPDVLVVYAGAAIAEREKHLRSVQERAASLRLGDRLRITGWLSEDDLETWVAATDLAVLPFRDLSASGSLSTWIAVARPILASDLPGFREYNERVPGAIRIAPSLEPRELARAINARLGEELPETDPLVAALRDDLSVPRSLDRYLEVGREAEASARP